MKKHLIATIAAASLFVANPAMAGMGMDHGDGYDGEKHDTMDADRVNDPVIQQWIEINDRMHDGMMMAFTGDPDTDFARGMIPHHQGAIEMAEVVLEHGTDPEIRALAEEIIEAQEAEIQMLEDWLAEHGVD